MYKINNLYDISDKLDGLKKIENNNIEDIETSKENYQNEYNKIKLKIKERFEITNSIIEILKNKNQNKLQDLVNKLNQCELLENKVNDDIKFAFKVNDKLANIQKESEDLFFNICKNINIKP